jgi:hypothetical protein
MQKNRGTSYMETVQEGLLIVSELVMVFGLQAEIQKNN